MHSILLFAVMFLVRLCISAACRPLDDRNKNCIDENYMHHSQETKAEGLELGLFHLAVSVWLCASVVVWSAFGCLKKKNQDSGAAPPMPAVAHPPAATARACPPSPFNTAPVLPAGKKKIQPLSSTTFLRVPHEYVKDLTIKGVLGLGASGRAYLASLRGSPVAVKVMEHNVRAGNTKLLGDMPVLAVPLDHPNILRTYRVAVIELPSSSASGLLPVKMKRLEFERPSSSNHETAGGSAATESFKVDLLDEYYDSDETWDIENAEEGLFVDEYEEEEEEEIKDDSEQNTVLNFDNGDSFATTTRSSRYTNTDSAKIGTATTTTNRNTSTESNSGGNFRAGRVVHLYDLLPHPRLSPEEIYLIDKYVPQKHQISPLLRTSLSAPSPVQPSTSETVSPSVASASTSVSTTVATTLNTIAISNDTRSAGESQSMPLPKGTSFQRTFPAQGLSKSLRPGMYEVWAILEFADMGSMEDHVVKKGFLRHFDGSPDQESILRLLLDVAKGMAELHRHAIVHTDLKPSNVMLVSSSTDPRGWVAKISDAGLLPLLDLTLTFTSIRHHSRLQCLPPELVLNNATTTALDVYCFSMLMWKTWTCERPFKHMKIGSFFEKVIENGERPDIPEGCPAAYAALMEECWATDPTARPSFESICAELENQLHQTISSKPSSSTK